MECVFLFATLEDAYPVSLSEVQFGSGVLRVKGSQCEKDVELEGVGFAFGRGFTMGGCGRQFPTLTACNCFASHPLSNPFHFGCDADFPVSACFFPFPPILPCLGVLA